MHKRKKGAIRGKHLLIISSIIVLNAMGLTYAYWTDQLDILTNIATGSINPTFCDDYQSQIKIVPDRNELNNDQNDPVSLSGNDDLTLDAVHGELGIDFSDDNHTMTITGWLEDGYNASIPYCVVNKGTIPVKYDQNGAKLEGGNQISETKANDGIKVQAVQESKVLEPGEMISSEQGNENPKVQIHKDNKEKIQNEEGDQYTFELKLPFDQWTKN